jgi:hypothetical protein
MALESIYQDKQEEGLSMKSRAGTRCMLMVNVIMNTYKQLLVEEKRMTERFSTAFWIELSTMQCRQKDYCVILLKLIFSFSLQRPVRIIDEYQYARTSVAISIGNPEGYGRTHTAPSITNISFLGSFIKDVQR